jgi:hypothetical protein
MSVKSGTYANWTFWLDVFERASYSLSGVTTLTTAKSTKPSVEKVEKRITLLLTLIVATISVLNMIDQKELLSNRSTTNLNNN